MARRLENTTLYALIAAGAAAREAISAPLAARGLACGDAAVLLALDDAGEVAEEQLGAELRLTWPRLRPHLRRLARLGMIERIAGGDDLSPHVRLTVKGSGTVAIVMQHWQAAENDLRGRLGPKKARRLRNKLRKTMRRIAD